MSSGVALLDRKKTLTAWVSDCEYAEGYSSRQRGMTYGQRVWKWQPLGGFDGRRTSPESESFDSGCWVEFGKCR
jgi:hypothetical protein